MIKNIFSTYLCSQEYNINTTSLKNHIKEIYKTTKTGRARSNYGGWQSEMFLKSNQYTKPLFEIINKDIKEIKKIVDVKDNVTLLNYWYNINKQSSFNRPHYHLGRTGKEIISGTFYVTTFKDCGNIMFKRNECGLDLMYERRIDNYTPYSSSNYFMTPKNNLCLLFPSNLEHYVEPNLQNKERISLSFNYGI